MKYLDKSFSVYIFSQKDEGCSKCQQIKSIYYVSQAGKLCPECYEKEKEVTLQTQEKA